MLAVVATSLVAFQLTPLPTSSALRAASPVMESRLNNYVLPGPMRPLGNQVMIKLRKADDKTTGGLFVPTQEVEKPKEGTVVMAGPGKAHPETGKLIECPVKEGDLVLLSDFSGEKVDYNGEQHIFTDADSILGSFEGQNPTISAFKPSRNLVVLAVSEQETETSTGIALAGLDEEEANSGEVVAVGPGLYAANGDLLAVSVASGESVMYARYGAADATIDGKPYKIVAENDCLVKW